MNNDKEKITNKEDFFKVLCKECAYAGDLITCAQIAKNYDISLYKTRKYMKEFLTEGMVYKTYFGDYHRAYGYGEDEDKDYVWCVHGWSLTDKAKDTETFKLIRYEISKQLLEYFEYDSTIPF